MAFLTSLTISMLIDSQIIKGDEQGHDETMVLWYVTP